MAPAGQAKPGKTPSKASKAKKSTQVASGRSAEFILDSDEDVGPSATPVKKPGQPTQTPKSSKTTKTHTAKPNGKVTSTPEPADPARFTVKHTQASNSKPSGPNGLKSKDARKANKTESASSTKKGPKTPTIASVSKAPTSASTAPKPRDQRSPAKVPSTKKPRSKKPLPLPAHSSSDDSSSEESRGTQDEGPLATVAIPGSPKAIASASRTIKSPSKHVPLPVEESSDGSAEERPAKAVAPVPSKGSAPASTTELQAKRRPQPTEDSSIDINSGESGSSSEEEEVSLKVPAVQRPPKAASPAKNKGKSKDTQPLPPVEDIISGSSSEDESENDGSGDSSSTGSTARQPDESVPEPAPQPVGPFKPPKEFSRASVTVPSSISSVFSRDNLQGKQLWHITVPSTIPLSAIKEVATQTIFRGEAVTSYKGSDYGFSRTVSEPESQRVFIPTQRGNKYAPISDEFSRSLTLHPIIKLPPVAASQNSHNVGTANVAARAKRIPQQPQGLRVRHRAFGASADSSESENEGEVAQPSQFRVPPPGPSQPRKEKRKAVDEPATSSTPQSFPSKKKRKKDKDPTSSQTVPTSTPMSSLTPKTNGDTSRVLVPDSQVPQDSSPVKAKENGLVNGDQGGETKEEKAARRAAKAKRKLEKRKKKEADA